MSYVFINNYPVPTAEQEIDLLTKAQAGDKEAFDYMTLANGGLVDHVCKRFVGKGLDRDDLYQVGIMGLMKAIERYDLKSNAKFSSYAYLWIRQYMIRTIQNESRTIRISANAYQKNYKLIVQSKKLEQELGRTPTTEELAEYTEKSTKEIRNFLQDMADTTSLNQCCADEGRQTELGDAIADKSTLDMTDEITTRLLASEMLETIKGYLSEKEYYIFVRHLGIGCEPVSYRDLGKEFGISGQRIEQVYKAALARLRRNKLIKMYKCS